MKAAGDANDAVWQGCRLPTYRSEGWWRLLVMQMMLFQKTVGCQPTNLKVDEGCWWCKWCCLTRLIQMMLFQKTVGCQPTNLKVDEKAAGDANDAVWQGCRLPTCKSKGWWRLLVMQMMLFDKAAGCQPTNLKADEGCWWCKWCRFKRL